MAQITYDDKVALNENPSVAEINKVTDDNMNEIKNAVNTNTPVGVITAYAGDTAPNGWLLCDGSAVSRTTYANLFSVLGTKCGAGDGSTTFNLPNIKGRSLVGVDPDDTDFNVVGKTGGEKTHTLTINEMPPEYISHVDYIIEALDGDEFDKPITDYVNKLKADTTITLTVIDHQAHPSLTLYQVKKKNE